MAKIRVLLVDDSVSVRKRLHEVLAGDADLEVVAEAEDGKRAISLCQALRPDVVTMDMMMPVMTGLSATEYIMAHCPTPILIVSSSTNRGELFKTYDALAAGAVEVLEKPRGDETDVAWEQQFIGTLKLVSRIRVITHVRARLSTPASRRPPLAQFDPTRDGATKREVIAIGASTGGPNALLQVLRDLAPDPSVPVLVVLHINEPFGRAFAEWLDAQVDQSVGYAENGALTIAGTGRVLLAPPGQHLVVHGGRLWLTRDPERHSCRPSIDVLFESVACEYGSGAAGCLLTGMGRDGAAGLLAMRRAGALTIAQDEATSVVYGMPREAVLLNAAERVLPLGRIGDTLAAFQRICGEARST